MVTVNSVTIAGDASLHQAEDRNEQSQAVSEEDGKSVYLYLCNRKYIDLVIIAIATGNLILLVETVCDTRSSLFS